MCAAIGGVGWKSSIPSSGARSPPAGVLLLPLCLLAQSTALEPVSVVVDNARATLRVSRDADMQAALPPLHIEQGIGNLKMHPADP